MRARRALLYMPGDAKNKIEKAALSLNADSVCMDLEDGVAADRKEKARQVVAHALQTLDFGRSEKLVRINRIGSGLEAEDLAAVLPYRPDGIVIPKVEDGHQVDWVSEQIAAAEREHGWPAGSIRLLAIVESAIGVVNLRGIAEGHPRLDALIFGAEDLAADLGATRTRAGQEVFYARSAVVTYAAAFGLQAIDMVFVNYKDTINLKIEARQGAQMGFNGKQIIHPAQIAPVHEAFTPKDDEIEHALRVVRAFEEAQAQGEGAFGLDGVMIDMPLVKAARNVLSRAQAAGKLPRE